MPAYTQLKDQVLSSTVPAHRMCQTVGIAFTFRDAGLHPDEGPSSLKYRACSQNVSDVAHSFTDASLHPDEGSSALKYRACSQHVTDAIHSFTLWGMPGYTQMRGQVLSNTAPMHRM